MVDFQFQSASKAQVALLSFQAVTTLTLQKLVLAAQTPRSTLLPEQQRVVPKLDEAPDRSYHRSTKAKG